MPKQSTQNFKQKGRRLSPELSKIILQSEEENRQILTTKDFVDFYKISDGYARKMIVDLVRNGWLVRVQPGKYQLQPARTGLEPYAVTDKFVAACQMSVDGFIAFGSAAEYHGLTTQIFQTVTVATPKRGGIHDGPPVRIEYVHVKEENFVGFQNSSKAPNMRVATIERTIIDAIQHPDYFGGISDIPEILRRSVTRTNVEKVLEYLSTFGSKSLIQRVGFALDEFDFKMSTDQAQKLQDWSKGTFAYLFSASLPGTDRQRRYSSKWRLVINAPGFLTKDQSE